MKKIKSVKTYNYGSFIHYEDFASSDAQKDMYEKKFTSSRLSQTINGIPNPNNYGMVKITTYEDIILILCLNELGNYKLYKLNGSGYKLILSKNTTSKTLESSFNRFPAVLCEKGTDYVLVGKSFVTDDNRVTLFGFGFS